jgi:hypothetical protein
MHTLSFCNQTVQTFTRTQKKIVLKQLFKNKQKKKNLSMREIKKEKKKESK